MDEKTYESPFNRAVEAEMYGAHDLDQHDLARTSFEKFLKDVFEQRVDLRGARFEVIVHADGLFCTVRRHDA